MAKTKTTPTNDIRVAYQEGPPDIHFFGKHWQREVVQTITQDEWLAMKQRADFKQFNFTEEN